MADQRHVDFVTRTSAALFRGARGEKTPTQCDREAIDVANKLAVQGLFRTDDIELSDGR